MSIVAWIILGLAAGIIASRLAPDPRSPRPALPGITGMAGAVFGGLAATLVISGQLAGGFLSPATWPAAVAGAAVLLLARRLMAGQQRERDRQAVPVPARRSRQPR